MIVHVEMFMLQESIRAVYEELNRSHLMNLTSRATVPAGVVAQTVRSASNRFKAALANNRI